MDGEIAESDDAIQNDTKNFEDIKEQVRTSRRLHPFNVHSYVLNLRQ
jgi:hypothetical protein